MKDILTSMVSISTGCDTYPSVSPYSPETAYPEYPFDQQALTEKGNQAYEGVRDCLQLLGLDAEHYDKKEWNPLGQFICPGNTVVLKPNFVREFRETQQGHEDCLITHGSVIRSAIDYVYIALKGKGRIIIADASQNDADFDTIRQMTGLTEIQAFYQKHADLEVEVYDLRPERAQKVDGVIVAHEKLSGDPAGYVKVDLGKHSMFCEISNLCHLLYGSEYSTDELRSHHHDDTHEYLVSKTILGADCVLNLPKLKTHKKTGVTISMKNLVGINGNKNWLPHHREGTPCQGGDQYSDDSIKHRVEQKAMACFRVVFPFLGSLRKVVAGPIKALGKFVFGDTNTDTVRSGNWYGNDTTWRMVIDLNRILMYADAEGNIQDSPVRQIFNIVDGIVGGEGNGPLDPIAKASGIIITGVNPVSVDLTCARLMGFDYKRLPVLYEALEKHVLPISPLYEDVICKSIDPQLNRSLIDYEGANLAFQPHFGWQGYIEIGNRSGL